MGERSCTERLDRDLGDIAALTSAAAVGYAGQDRVSRQSMSKPEPDPDANLPQTASIQRLPWDEGTSLALRNLHSVLVAQTRMVIEELSIPFERIAGPGCVLCTHSSCRATRVAGWPADSLPAMAAWLLGQVPWLRRHPAAVEVLKDVGDAVRRLRWAIDLAPELLFAGPCDGNGLVSELAEAAAGNDTAGCGERLYAQPDREETSCRMCSLTYRVEIRREWLLEAAEDVLAHAELIGRAAPAFGLDVTPAAIRGYAHRGRLLERGLDLQGNPLYRVGDVIDVARDVLAERERKRAESERQRSRRAGSRRSA